MTWRDWTRTGLALVLLGGAAVAADAGGHPIYGRTMELLSGGPIDLSQYKGKVLLFVNVASRCGATPQYEPLQALYEKYKDQGLVVVGVPCNQFGRQEPGTGEQIAAFCKKNYGVTFPMTAKVDVNGPEAAPLYGYLTSAEAVGEQAGPVKWNFEKFLVGRNGEVVARIGTRVKPDAPEVVEAIERELAKK